MCMWLSWQRERVGWTDRASADYSRGRRVNRRQREIRGRDRAGLWSIYQWAEQWWLLVGVLWRDSAFPFFFVVVPFSFCHVWPDLLASIPSANSNPFRSIFHTSFAKSPGEEEELEEVSCIHTEKRKLCCGVFRSVIVKLAVTDVRC